MKWRSPTTTIGLLFIATTESCLESYTSLFANVVDETKGRPYDEPDVSISMPTDAYKLARPVN